MSERKKSSGYVEIDGKCAACCHAFTQRLQMGEHPFCPRCGSSDIVKLPTIEEMSGLIPNFTGGLTMKEYMEMLSDGW